MSSLLTLAFWFNLRPGSMSALSQRVFLALIIVLIIGAIIFFIYKRKKGAYKHSFALLYNFFLTNAVLGFSFLFFNYEIVPFFSAHFWYLLWALVIVWWLIYIIKDFKKVALKQKESPKNDDITKYLP